nr:hypothetical protein [Verrucomicrobium spinosum]
MSVETPDIADIRADSVGDFYFPENHVYDAGYGLSEKTIDYICDVKNDPDWVREFRKKALKVFEEKPMPTHWATTDLNNIKFEEFRYYLAGDRKAKRSWDDVPEEVKKTFERLGIPEQERKFLAGVEAQYDSEAAYSNVKKVVEEQGVIFMNSTEASSSIRRSSASGLARSSPPGTTSSARSTAPCSAAARSSTSPRA